MPTPPSPGSNIFGEVTESVPHSCNVPSPDGSRGKRDTPKGEQEKPSGLGQQDLMRSCRTRGRKGGNGKRLSRESRRRKWGTEHNSSRVRVGIGEFRQGKPGKQSAPMLWNKKCREEICKEKPGQHCGLGMEKEVGRLSMEGHRELHSISGQL